MLPRLLLWLQKICSSSVLVCCMWVVMWSACFLHWALKTNQKSAFTWVHYYSKQHCPVNLRLKIIEKKIRRILMVLKIWKKKIPTLIRFFRLCYWQQTFIRVALTVSVNIITRWSCSVPEKRSVAFTPRWMAIMPLSSR